MQLLKARGAVFIFTALSFLFLAGCATQRSLYHWGSFPDVTYAWLKDEPESGDVSGAMEEDVQRAISKGHDLPPGFQAHLGLLYMQAGQFDKAVEYWQMEKAAFPESTPFMDFLLQSLQGQRFIQRARNEIPRAQVSGEEAL
ncbi:hypothetical protein AXK11_08640 [Cephaloticoccus primus]|uniref:DUF4810 domain-containing protein n=1 Tax=Cephaloticoccus primus TaxID=1548207 RepID=A0A139SII8_9BACT|nr:DUF4810 domain-containing protein [Cephaloticoccus primus]KXU34367.1 hypothetical protein AXK11_08640 [Cephaloticoccus primus]